MSILPGFSHVLPLSEGAGVADAFHARAPGLWPSRAVLLGEPCLLSECLREALQAADVETSYSCLTHPLSPPALSRDIFVVFLARCGDRTVAFLKQRMHELRLHSRRPMIVGLVEDASDQANALCAIGFTALVIGIPSVTFAVDFVRLMLGSAMAAGQLDADEAHELVATSLEQPERERRLTVAVIPGVCFTARELQLLELLRRGMQNKLMAHELGISVSTVKAHLRSIMMKLKAKNRTQAICTIEGLYQSG